MITDIINNKKLISIVTELFVRGTKLNICLVFITHSYFEIPVDVRLNTTHFLLQIFQIKESFKKFQETVHPILKLTISLISIANALLNHIRFLLMILRLHQIILYSLENYF